MLKQHIISISLFVLLFSSCSSDGQENDSGGSNFSKGDIKYLGAFKLPEGRVQMDNGYYGTFKSSGAAVVFNKEHDSLILQSRAETSGYQKVYHTIAEVSIPSPVIDEIEDLPEAELITDHTNIISDVVADIQSKYEEGEGHGIGGLLIDGDYLYGTIYRWHNCGDPIPVSHFYSKLSDLNTANTIGPLAIDAGELNGYTAPSGAMAGYMSKIPNDLQDAFGYEALTGSLHGSEIGGRFGRCSSGPAAFGFNPQDFLRSNTIQGEQFIYHPTDHVMPDTNAIIYYKGHDINGMAFVTYPDNSHDIIYAVTYANEPYYWDSGYMADSYDVALFYYSPDDLLKVKTGEKKQYELTPYKAVSLTEYFFTDKYMVKSMAYDPGKNRLFIVENDGNDPYPLVHVFDIDE